MLIYLNLFGNVYPQNKEDLFYVLCVPLIEPLRAVFVTSLEELYSPRYAIKSTEFHSRTKATRYYIYLDLICLSATCVLGRFYQSVMEPQKDPKGGSSLPSDGSAK